MIDLTGCPFLTVRFEDPDVQEDYRNGELWSQLVSWDAHDYVMSCSTPGREATASTIMVDFLIDADRGCGGKGGETSCGTAVRKNCGSST